MSRRGRNLGLAAVAAMIAVGGASTAPAQDAASRPGPPPPRSEPMPEEVRGVGVDEKRGDTLPLDLAFTDEQGRSVELGDFFSGDKPVILNLAYYRCPMLCGLVMDGMVQAAGRLAWTPGREYEIVTVSIDPGETPALASSKKKTAMMYVDRRGAEAGWHFLTGDQVAIDRLTDALGWRYNYIPETNEYAHPAVIMVITPEGTVSRYLYGVQFPPNTMRLSLVEAADGKVGSATDRFLLFCFHFDDETGQYTANVMNIMRLAGALTVVLIAVGIGGMLLREHLKRRSATHPVTA